MDRIGTIKFYLHQFTWTPENGSYRNWRPLDHRPCTMKDLTAFTPTISDFVGEAIVADYYCLELGEYTELWNNNLYDSTKIQIRLDPCVGPKCYVGKELQEHLSLLFVDYAWTS